MQTSFISTEVVTRVDQQRENELLKKSPAELLDYLLKGGAVPDTPQIADRLMDMLIPKSHYYEIALLGEEYCFRTNDRKVELLRVPRTLGGLILMTSRMVQLVEQSMVYVATGGKGF